MGLIKAAFYIIPVYIISEVILKYTTYVRKWLETYIRILPDWIRIYIENKIINRETIMFYLLVVALILF